MVTPHHVLSGPAVANPPTFFITGSVDGESTTGTSGKFRRPVLPNYLLEAYQRLTVIGAFQMGWDSYGASPIGDRAIAVARELLVRLPRRLGDVEDARPYAIAPLASGGIQMEWRGLRKALEIEIDTRGRLSSLVVEDHETGRTYDERDRISAPEAISLVSQTLGA